jgi:hypothetical protein
MINQVVEIHGQSRNVIPGLELFRYAMATQIRYNDMIILRECRRIAREDGAGAREAVKLAGKVSRTFQARIFILKLPVSAVATRASRTSSNVN